MHYRKVMNRKTLLRGAGSIAIGLPFLDAMRTRSVYAKAPEPPARSVTVFFGLGVPSHVQDDHLAGLTGSFEPLQRHRAKLGFTRGIQFPDGRHQGGGMNPFVGENYKSLDQAGGPSIDQVMLEHLYGGNAPGAVPTVGMGVFGSYQVQSESFRRIKSWKKDGSPSILPKIVPSELFTRIFGSAPSVEAPVETARDRMRRSVLDTVMDQYRHLTSDGSNLGKQSRSRIKEHLDRIREYEVRAFSTPPLATSCEAPQRPGDPNLMRGQTSQQGIDFRIDDVTAVWRINVDLMVAALGCDATRFAWGSFLNVGDRLDLRGDYVYEGQQLYSFNDTRDWQNQGGDGNQGSVKDEGRLVSHEWFHAWDKRGGPGENVGKHHLHWHMREIAYLLSKLDDTAFTDENGGTLLDNAMVMITTELSDPGQHLTRDVLHMLGSANERFRIGGNITGSKDNRRSASDLYNTVLRAYGIQHTMAPSHFDRQFDGIRV